VQAGAKKPAISSVDVVVIGAGHSGLAMSRILSSRSIEHVILERGHVANSWRHERWDSLRLLTPNWLSRLPDFSYAGGNPDGYMTTAEVIDFIDGYASFSRAPVETGTEVLSVRTTDNGYHLITNRGEWLASAVVIASGAFNVPVIPAVSAGIDA
jgi:putative flavoprotein involved in K+ transport